MYVYDFISHRNMIRRLKKDIFVSFLISIYIFISLSHALTLDNVLKCDMFPKDSVPEGYYPLIGVAALLTDDEGNPLNAHLTELSDDIVSGDYGYVIACDTHTYAELRGVVTSPPSTCEENHYAYVINMSDRTNAHVKSPYSWDVEADYPYEFCIDMNIPSSLEGLSGFIYCDVRDAQCQQGEVCLFKFASEDVTIPIDSNAHVYDCDTSIFTSPAVYDVVCCKILLNTEGDIITDIKSAMISNNQLFLQLGMYSQFLVTLYNPSSRPQSITLKLDSTDDQEGTIFRNFIWFSKKGGITREETIILEPHERDYITVNVFGGKIGRYTLYIKRELEESDITLYAINVTVVPSSVEGVYGESSEFGSAFLLIALSIATLLLYRKL